MLLEGFDLIDGMVGGEEAEFFFRDGETGSDFGFSVQLFSSSFVAGECISPHAMPYTVHFHPLYGNPFDELAHSRSIAEDNLYE